jgi:hyperosmotically inducible protein
MMAIMPHVPTLLLPGVVAILALGCAACSQAISPTVLQDVQTAVSVKTVLVNDAVLGVRPIEVTVSNGIVRLSGSVASDAEAQRAVALARSVNEVRDVRSELVVRITGAESASPAAKEEPAAALQSDAPRLLSVGVSLRHSRPGDEDLGTASRLGPLIRLGSGPGLGLTLGFGWFSTDVASGVSRLGRLRIRPVMAGLAYTLGDDRVSASLSLVGGVAFNSLSQQHRSAGPVWALDVSDSFAWRPGVSLWVDLSRRTALNVSAGYLVTRPRLSVLDDDRVQPRAFRGDAVILSTGVAYKLF